MTSPKIVFVTGGNGGIGYETVKALLQSERPYKVLMGSRSLEKADEAIKVLQAELQSITNTVQPIQLDLVSDESIQNAFEKVQAEYGRLDILINNAGESHFNNSSPS